MHKKTHYFRFNAVRLLIFFLTICCHTHCKICIWSCGDGRISPNAFLCACVANMTERTHDAFWGLPSLIWSRRINCKAWLWYRNIVRPVITHRNHSDAVPTKRKRKRGVWSHNLQGTLYQFYYLFVLLLPTPLTLISLKYLASQICVNVLNLALAQSLRIQPWNLTHPSCQPPIDSVFGQSHNCIGFHYQSASVQLWRYKKATAAKSPEKNTKTIRKRVRALLMLTWFVYVAVAAVYSALDGIFIFFTATLWAFLGDKDVFAWIPAGFGKSLAHRSALWQSEASSSHRTA